MSRTLIIAEHDGQSLNQSTSKCVSCALAIGNDIDIVVLGSGAEAVTKEAAAIDGVSTVISVDAEHLAQVLAVNLAAEVVAIADDYSHIMGPSTTFGRDLMPSIAAKLGVNQVSDIAAVEAPQHFKRPIYAGNAIVDVTTPDGAKVVATVRTASWKAAGSDGNASIESRGAGASRAAVDAGYCPNDMQVGQTGKIISPDLYMAFGISGAIQHITGIKDAGTIVAINKDAEAPIFEIADIGLASDLFTVIPELKQLLA